MNGNKRLKDTKTIVKDIFQEHPDWNARQIYDRYLILIGDASKAVTLNAVQKHVETFKDISSRADYQDLERPWHVGLMAYELADDKHPEYGKYPIPAEAVPYILEAQVWLYQNKQDLLTIRGALWVSRVYPALLGEKKPPLSDEDAKKLVGIALFYAKAERLCQLSETVFDTTILDQELRKSIKGRVRNERKHKAKVTR